MLNRAVLLAAASLIFSNLASSDAIEQGGIVVPEAVPDALRERSDKLFGEKTYEELPWDDLTEFDFYPRELYAPPQPQLPMNSGPDAGIADVPSRTDLSDGEREPSKTVLYRHLERRWTKSENDLVARSTYTFSCPTSVQCVDGGCCPVGDYCAIRNGQYGCCPIGSLCDALPIPGCNVACYGICCDLVQDIIGEPVCSPTPGEGGQASGLCTGVAPSSPLYTPPASCPGSEFLCGNECCPSGSGLICDNVTIPGQPFCNVPANVCPPGTRRVRRQAGGNSSSTTDDCLATTATQLFSSRITPNGSTTTAATTSASMPMTGSAASTGGAASSSSLGSPVLRPGLGFDWSSSAITGLGTVVLVGMIGAVAVL